MNAFRYITFLALALILACAVTLPQAQAQISTPSTSNVTITVTFTVPQTEYDNLTKVARAQRSAPKEDANGVITQTPLYKTFEEFVAAQVGQFMQQMYDRLGANKPVAVSDLEKQIQSLQDQLTTAKKVPVTVTKQ